MFDVEVLEAIQNKYEMLLPYLNERGEYGLQWKPVN